MMNAFKVFLFLLFSTVSMYSMDDQSSLSIAVNALGKNDNPELALALHKVVIWKPEDFGGSRKTDERKAYIKQYEEQIAPKTIEDYKVESIKALIKMGAPVNEVDGSKETALMLAVKKPQNLLLVNALLDNRADPNIADQENHTPLLRAVSSPHNIQIISLLMQHGADPYKKIITKTSSAGTKKEKSILRCAQKICIANYTIIVTELAKKTVQRECKLFCVNG